MLKLSDVMSNPPSTRFKGTSRLPDSSGGMCNPKDRPAGQITGFWRGSTGVVHQRVYSKWTD